MTTDAPAPVEIKLLQKSRILELNFPEGEKFSLSCEYLRVHSPSAEVKGHGGGEGILQVGKKDVNIIGIDPVGNYGLKFIFDDGHDSGIFTWDFLFDLGIGHEKNWQRYLERLEEAGMSREAKKA